MKAAHFGPGVNAAARGRAIGRHQPPLARPEAARRFLAIEVAAGLWSARSPPWMTAASALIQGGWGGNLRTDLVRRV